MVQFLARGLTGPLRELADATHDMSAGRYDRRVYTASMDEVGELAEAFNRMAAELAAVDTERRELIANVSHELRTPISAMQAVMENIVDGVEPADPATMRTMLAQVERLGRLVTQLLDLSRLDARDTNLETKPFAVAPLLEAAVEGGADRHPPPGRPERAPRAQRRPARAGGDRRPRAHPPGGGQPAGQRHLALARRRAGGRGRAPANGSDANGVELEVSDEGPGIPPEEAARVFDRFYRGNGTAPPGRRHRPGAGHRQLDRRPARRDDRGPQRRRARLPHDRGAAVARLRRNSRPPYGFSAQ